MKKICISIVLIVVSMVSFAQIGSLYPFTKEVITTINGKDSTVEIIDSSLVINKIYAGSLSGTNFHTDSLYSSGFTGLRFGAMGTYKPAKWISFSSWGMVQIDGGAKSWSLQQFWMTIEPIKKLTFQIGSMATLPTEQRPHPVSGNGQFETWSEASIPGMSLNAKLKYDITSDVQLAGGIALRNGSPEYSGRITYKKVQLSGWYSTYDATSGVAATIDMGRVYSTFVYKPNQTIADIFCLKISKKHDITFYSDMGYDFVKKDLVRAELGVLKGFESKWIKGLWGLGYQYETETINGYFFIHL